MSNLNVCACGCNRDLSVEICGTMQYVNENLCKECGMQDMTGHCVCKSIEVPEVDVYVSEVCPDCKELDCYCEQKNEDFHVCMNFGCRNTPEYGKGMCDECWKGLHEKAPEACITCGVKISTGALCGPCRVKEFTPDEIEGSVSGEDVLCAGCGKEECFCSFIDLVESDWAENVSDCDTFELEDEDFIYAYTAEDKVCDVCDSSEEPNENGFYLEQDEPEPVAVAVAPLWVELVMAAMMIVSFFGLVIDIATGKNNNPKLVMGFYLVCAYLIVTYSAAIIWFLC